MKCPPEILLLILFFINSFVESRFSLSAATLKILKRKAEHTLDTVGGNTQCAKDLKILIHDFMFMKKWALEMVDSSGKVNSGLFQGNNVIVGSFDGCLDISVERSNHTINGKYCTVVLAPSHSSTSEFSFLFDNVAISNYLGLKLSNHSADMIKMAKATYGLCIPESCSISNLQKLWDYIEHNAKAPVHLKFDEIMCRSKAKPIEPNNIDSYIYILFGIYATIILLSTLYDLLIHQEFQPRKNTIWISFSVWSNCKKIFSYEPISKFGYLECINGIKVWSMLWIIYCHRVLYSVFSGVTNGVYLFVWKQQLSTTLVLGGALAVDTFFVLSGLLLSYGFLKYKSQCNAKINFLGLNVYRFFRLSPALLAVMLFRIGIFKHLGDGPIWPYVVRKSGGTCQYTGWATALYIVNLVDHNYQCMDHTWYLAVDTQLFLISPIILIGLTKNPWKTSLICMAVCVLSGIYAFVITINNNLGCIYFEATKPYIEYIYMSTIARSPPWLIGIVFGLLLFQYQQIRIPKVTAVFTWILSTSTLAGLIIVHIVFSTQDYDPLKAAIFNATVRQIWSFAIGTIVFLCSTGHGGFINKFLSLPIYQVLVKLSYSIYLIHLDVIFYSIGTRRHAEYFSNIKLVRDFFGDLFFTFIGATICCLAFESPFIVISKLMFKLDKEQEFAKQIEKVSRKKRSKKVFNLFNGKKQFYDKKYS